MSTPKIIEEITELQKTIEALSCNEYTDIVGSVAIENMKKKEFQLKETAVKAVHTHKISEANRIKNGKPYHYWTTVVDSSGKTIKCSQYESLIEKLFFLYYPDGFQNKNFTLRDVYEKYTDYQLNFLKTRPKTVCREKYDWNIIGSHSISSEKVGDITVKKLTNFFHEITPTMTEKKFRNIKSLMNSLFQYAFAELEIIPYDICSPLEVKPGRGYKFIPSKSHKAEVYTKNEREAILQYIENLPHQNGYTWAARLMFCFDCRAGEVKALKWADYYPTKFQTPMMFFHSQVVIDQDEKGKYFLNDLGYTKAKTGEGERLEPVTLRAIRVLEEIKATNPTSEYILTTQSGGPLYQTGRINNVFKEACAALGIEYHSSHRCRNYSITEQSRAGFDVNVIAQNSGHVNEKTTLSYMRHVAFSDEDFVKWEKVHG